MKRTGIVLFLAVVAFAAASCAADTPTYPSPPPPPPGVILATQPSQLQAFMEPALIAGGATTIKVMAMGRASDGNLRGVPNLPVHWATTAGSLSKAAGTLSDTTDLSGLAAIVLAMPKSDVAIDLGVDIEAGGLAQHLAVVVAPSSVHGPPGPVGGTGSTGSTGGTGSSGGSGG